MPHDSNGVELAVGDKVTATGIVKSISPGETACNCTVELDAPEGEYKPTISCNTRTYTKVEEPEDGA